MSIIRGYDPVSLREIVDADEARARLGEIGAQRSLPSLLERVWLLKVLGDLDQALEVGDQVVRTARMGATRQDLLRARVLHATVLQARGALSAAELELDPCVEEAEGQGWASIAAFARQHRGKVRLEAGDPLGAAEDFEQWKALRKQLGATDAEMEVIAAALRTAERTPPAEPHGV